MKHARAWSSIAVVGLLAGALPLLAESSAVAAPPPGGPTVTQNLSAFNGTHSGPDPVTVSGDRPVYYRFDAAKSVSLADLGLAGSATFTTTVRADAGAATWTTDGELEAAGLAQVVGGETFVSNGQTFNGANPLGSPSHDGDPIVFAQYNGGGPGNPTCANGKFYVGGSWVFGTGTICQIANDSSDQTTPVDGGAQRYTITIHGDGTWTGSVTPLDADGDVVTSFNVPGVQTFSGTLPGSSTTQFAPVLRLRPGSATGGNWSYTISGSSLTTTVAPVHVVTGGNVSADGSSGWALETLHTGNGSFVQGTGTPPLGSGSYHLKSNVTGDKDFLHLTKVDGVALAGQQLSDIKGLSYASYASDGTFSPYVNIPIHSGLIDSNNDGIADGTQSGIPAATGNAVLIYDPTVSGGSWQNVDTMAAAHWRLSRTVVSGGVTPLWTYKTWADWSALLADGIVNPTYGDIQWSIGDTSSAAWGGREGWVDDISVVTTTASATYDLEEGLGSCPVAIDNGTKTLTLTADCTTSQTLTVHDGWTLNGAGHTITVIDPSSGSFTGPALTNYAGATQMDIKNVHLVGNLANGCSASLYGVQFNGAGGSLTHSSVANIRYGTGSGCQSGNSVDITNLGGATRLPVTVDDVQVTGFQKTGIRANGNIALRLTDSTVASSDLDLITASNSLQISRGARAYVADNTIAGNDWDGNADWNATGVLLYGADDVTFVRNVVNGTDTDVALYVSEASGYPAGRTTLSCNLFSRDAAADSTPTPGTALDIWNLGVAADATLTATIDATGNTVEGFATPWDNVEDVDGGACASGPVTALAVGGTTSSVTATWTAPAGLDYAPVSGYDVTLLPGGTHQTVTNPTVTFTGLAPAKQYSVTVVPLNAAGTGTPRSASGLTRPGGATISSTATTDHSASFAWTVPGTEYTSFDLTVSDSGGVVSSHSAAGDARSWTFKDLDPETAYTLTVTPRQGTHSGTADNADVTTDADAGSAPTAPGPVTGLSLSGSGTTLTAHWSAPGGATDYEATLIPGGQVVDTSGTSAAFTITPGKDYTVTVIAHNVAGWSPGRSASLDTALPGAPLGLSAVGGTTSADLTWSPAVSPTAISTYTIVATPTTGTPVTRVVSASGLTFPVTISGLVKKRAYTFDVTATNAFGTGPAASKTLQASLVKVTAFKKAVTYGGFATIKGQVTDATTGAAASGQTITLKVHRVGTTGYVLVTGLSARTKADGSFALRYKMTASAHIIVIASGAGRMAAIAPSISVRAHAKSSLSPKHKLVSKGQTVHFNGTVRPGKGTLVQLQHKVGKRWVLVRAMTVRTSAGRWALSWHAAGTGKSAFRVRVLAKGMSAGYSPSRWVVVA